MNYNKLLFSFLIITSLGSCKKYIEVDPPIQEIIGKEIFENDNTAISVLSAIYADMNYYSLFSGKNSITVFAGVSSDELTSIAMPSDPLQAFYLNAVTNDDGGVWGNLYAYIFRINAAFEGISNSDAITTDVKQQLLAECKFLRAFMYFYLVNLYGDVPLLTTTDIKINSTAPRTSKAEVYTQIVKDLKEAQEGLSVNYLGGDLASVAQERFHPNKAVATALLARVYLYTAEWASAVAESDKLINNSAEYVLEDIENVFTAHSREVIWQLQSVIPSINVLDAQLFTLADGNGIPAGPNPEMRPVYLSQAFYNDFESADLRKINWTNNVAVDGFDYPYSAKYKVWLNDEPRTEALVMFRLAEQYLIRAEARAKLGNITGENSSSSDINAIRSRAGLADLNISDEEQMLQALINERRFELFLEHGHRWFDLKRTGTIDQVMTAAAIDKGSTWDPTKALLPIPLSDIKRNPSLRGHQNPGYPEQ